MEIILTKHVQDRMKKRHITREEIEDAIRNADKTGKKDGKYYAKKNIGRAIIEVVYEKDKYINIITVHCI